MSYYYYDYGDDEEIDSIGGDYDTIFEDNNHPIYSWGNTYETCILPSTLQILWYMSILFGCSLFARIVLAAFSRFQTKSDWLLHSVSFVAGCSVLIITVGKNTFIIVGVITVSYTILRFLYKFSSFRRSIGVFMLLFILITHLSYEYILKKRVAWQVIQGPIMISNMKIISIAFEIGESGSNSRHSPASLKVFSFFGYIFMPSNLILGPWVPFNTYLYSTATGSAQKSHTLWILWCLLSSLLSLSFLNLSNCIVPLAFASTSTIWIKIFRDAFAVRCSHYFVSFLSQASIAAGGTSLKKDVKPNRWLGYMVSQPLQIEMPRSLSVVVRTWNIPTHDFLKEFIFRGVYRSFGSHLIAIIATYFISALLHGEQLKIYLILLSLASFAYVEHKLREKIATAFDACVTANMCRKPCRFKFCPSHGWRSNGAVLVKLTNLLFSLLAIFHLAYLGAMMNDSTVQDKEPNTIGLVDNISIWSSVSYVNHWIALLTFCVYLII